MKEYQSALSIANTAIKARERDLNAGLNLAMAVSLTECACVLENAYVARVRQEYN